ncbi:MAG TPA: DUF3768 domain-containing protein [Candidatus Saccharimonadales bacterium]|nr:DUF3768 domain-containing protein [Candidatus Saccharimonadales bacterium]
MKGKITRIAALNDHFRQTSNHFLLTNGVSNLPNIPGLIGEIRRYKDFNEDNDPYEEHDFGNLSWQGRSIFWKIDYYDQQLSQWHDPAKDSCKRILTVLLADEY